MLILIMIIIIIISIFLILNHYFGYRVSKQLLKDYKDLEKQIRRKEKEIIELKKRNIRGEKWVQDNIHDATYQLSCLKTLKNIIELEYDIKK